MTNTCLAPAAAALVVLLLATSAAQAQTANRAWVSGHGTDAAGCGAPTAPCRSLQFTHDNIVVAGGEIDVLDPAGYGAITITKAINIINDGVGTAGVQRATSAVIIINAQLGDAVRLRGLDIEGLGTADTGITFNSGGSLLVEDSSIDGVTFAGINFIPTTASTLFVANTKVTHCGGQFGRGIYLEPSFNNGTVAATIERLEAVSDTQAAVFVDARESGLLGAHVIATVSDSVLSGNLAGVEGISDASHAPAFVVVRNSTLTNNTTALDAEANSDIFVGHSTLSHNTTAFAQASGAAILSYGDNNVVILQGDALGATPLTAVFH